MCIHTFDMSSMKSYLYFDSVAGQGTQWEDFEGFRVEQFGVSELFKTEEDLTERISVNCFSIFSPQDLISKYFNFVVSKEPNFFE